MGAARRNRWWWALWGSVVLVCAAHGAEPILGTFGHDPVVLIEQGRDIRGTDAFSAVHGCYRYLFSTAESRARFLTSPDAYAIQLGGGCARMGALSGVGDPQRFAVHDKRIYIFASDGCRSSFLQMPDRFLEPSVDPEGPEPDAAALARGAALIGRAVEWLGGAAHVDSAIVKIEQRRVVDHEGAPHTSATTVVVAPGMRRYSASQWGAAAWVQVLAPDDAFFVEPDTGVRTMDGAQRRALQRKYYSDVLALLQARQRSTFRASAAPFSEETGAPVSVQVRCDGFEHTLAIDPHTGRIHRHALTAWGPPGVLGLLDRTYVEWRDCTGVRVPARWTQQFDGRDIDTVDRLTDGTTLERLETLPAELLARP